MSAERAPTIDMRGMCKRCIATLEVAHKAGKPFAWCPACRSELANDGGTWVKRPSPPLSAARPNAPRETEML